MTAIGCQIWRVDHDYVKTMGMNILNGRNFSVEMLSDSQAVIINQAMAKALNMNDPARTTYYQWMGRIQNRDWRYGRFSFRIDAGKHTPALPGTWPQPFYRIR